MDSVKFSIVIPTYNRGTLLQRCLTSIINQTYSNWEAIVVDNFSTDNTKEVVYSFDDSRIRFYQNHNYGIIAVSRNKALDVSTGDWICFLDSDDYWLPNKLESIIPYTKNYDLVYHGYRKDIKKTSLLERRDVYFYEIKEVTIPYVLMRGDPISPSCASVSIKALGTTRFSEAKELVAVEDYDFFLQLIEKKIKIKYLHKILTVYDMNGCSHDIKVIERDAVIFSRWINFLNDKEKEVLQYRQYRTKGDYNRASKRYSFASVYYKKLFASPLREHKMIAVTRYCFCLMIRFFKIIAAKQ